MTEIVYYLNTFTQVMIFSFLFYESLGARRPFIFTIIIWEAGAAAFRIISLCLSVPKAALTIPTALIPAILLTLSYEGTALQKIIRYLVFLASALLSRLAVDIFIRRVFSLGSSCRLSMETQPVAVSSGSILISSVTLIASAIFLICLDAGKSRSERRLTSLLTILGYALAHTLYLAVFYMLDHDSMTMRINLTQLLFQALLYCVIIMQYYSTKRIDLLAKRESEIKAAEKEKESRLRYMELADSKLRDITQLKNDVKEQLADVKRLMKAEAQDSRTAEDVMQEMLDRLNSIKAVNYCDNKTLNAVLTVKLNEKRVKDINIQTCLRDCTLSGIDNYDICSLVSNLLDNAIESCLREPEPSGTFIEIKSCITAELFVLKVTNSCTVSFDESSSKGEGHGYGLKIVDEICRRHGGEFTVRQKDGTVISSAFMRVET